MWSCQFVRIDYDPLDTKLSKKEQYCLLRNDVVEGREGWYDQLYQMLPTGQEEEELQLDLGRQQVADHS